MALYRDNNGVPSSIVASTTATALVAGRNHIPVTPALVSAGFYWITATYDGPVRLTKDQTALPYRYLTQNFSQALPNNFAEAGSTTVAPFNYYVITD